MQTITRVELAFNRYGDEETSESFNLTFNLQDETLGQLFDKFEVFMHAMGFVVEGKELRLVDRETENNNTVFLAEKFDYSNLQNDDIYHPLPPFHVIKGEKE